MTLALILLPALAAAVAAAIRSDRLRRALLVAVAGAHLALTAACWIRPS